MKRIQLLFLACLCAAFFTACPTPVTPSLVAAPKTIDFQPDGNGFIQFYTNNISLLNSWFCETYDSTWVGSISTVTATLVKNSGAVNIGYGVVFACTDLNNFYRVRITEDGYYDVQKKVNGVYTELQSWIASTAVHTGFGVQNIISAQYSGGIYSININGVFVFSFPFDPTLVTNGPAGFYVDVGTAPYESLPAIPVDIRFQITSPVSVP